MPPCHGCQLRTGVRTLTLIPHGHTTWIHSRGQEVSRAKTRRHRVGLEGSCSCPCQLQEQLSTLYVCVYVCVCMEVLVAQSCLTPWDPMDCTPPGSSVCGILQARILEWVAISLPRGSSWPRDRTWVSCIAGRFFTIWATREALCNSRCILNKLLIRNKENQAHVGFNPGRLTPKWES